MTDLPRPARTFKLKVGDETRTITMTYSVFTEITKVVQTPDQITNLVVTDPYLREYVIRRMLTPGKVDSDEQLVDTFDLDIDIEQLEDLVSWVAEHVLHFFMKSAEKTAAVGKKYGTKMEELTPSNPSQSGAEV